MVSYEINQNLNKIYPYYLIYFISDIFKFLIPLKILIFLLTAKSSIDELIILFLVVIVLYLALNFLNIKLNKIFKFNKKKLVENLILKYDYLFNNFRNIKKLNLFIDYSCKVKAHYFISIFLISLLSLITPHILIILFLILYKNFNFDLVKFIIRHTYLVLILTSSIFIYYELYYFFDLRYSVIGLIVSRIIYVNLKRYIKNNSLLNNTDIDSKLLPVTFETEYFFYIFEKFAFLKIDITELNILSSKNKNLFLLIDYKSNNEIVVYRSYQRQFEYDYKFQNSILKNFGYFPKIFTLLQDDKIIIEKLMYKNDLIKKSFSLFNSQSNNTFFVSQLYNKKQLIREFHIIFYNLINFYKYRYHSNFLKYDLNYNKIEEIALIKNIQFNLIDLDNTLFINTNLGLLPCGKIKYKFKVLIHDHRINICFNLLIDKFLKKEFYALDNIFINTKKILETDNIDFKLFFEIVHEQLLKYKLI